MAKSYRPWTPDQPYLFPPSPRDWVDPEHLVFFLMDVVSELDLRSIDDALQSKDPRGTRPYDPRMLTALLLYGYCTGMRSSRALERATWNDLPTRVLVGEQHPDHTVISRFRRRHLAALEGLFVQVLQLCARAGLVKLGHVSLDGTKVQANASKHKAMSHGRMVIEEERLAAEVASMLADAEAIDREEDARFGAERRGDELPDELRRRESRLRRIRQAKAELEVEAAQGRVEVLEERQRKYEQQAAGTPGDEPIERGDEQPKVSGPTRQERRKSERLAAKARKQAEAARKKLEAKKKAANYAPEPAPETPTDLPQHRAPWDRHGDPKPKAQRNFTDSESRIMVSGGQYLQAYNSQAVVDSAAQVVVAADVSNAPPDTWHLQPMVQQAIENTGAVPQVLTADNGYYADENAAFCEDLGVEAFISTGRLTDNTLARQAMTERNRSTRGKELYRMRKAIAEPVFGHIKEPLRFRRFSMKGLAAAKAEWRLVCTAHNLLKLWRFQPAMA